MNNEDAARMNAQNCGGMVAQQQWGLYPMTTAPECIEGIRLRLRMRAEELKKRIASVDADRAELESIERMLQVDKVEV